MSTISSNTLFHFTNTADNIIEIIKNGFKPRFCLEAFGPEVIIGKVGKIEVAIPMTCFCDLPLSKISTHLEFYGYYGIGLSKEWGQANGLTPITYIHDNSTQIKYLRQVGAIIFEVFGPKKTFNKLPMEIDPVIALFELSAFFKQYSGQMWRIDKYIDKRFYDEREWRYVPFIKTKEIQYRLNKDEFF